MHLIDILNSGWPVRWKGQTLFVSPLGPLAWARLDQMLRARFLADSADPEQAIKDIRAGAADYGSQWAATFLATDSGTLLYYVAALTTRQPWITPADVADILADPVTAAQLVSAVRLAASDVPEQDKDDPEHEQETDWGSVIGVLLKVHPAWTLADVARLSDAQIRFVFDAAAADDAGKDMSRYRQGEFSLDDMQPEGGN